MRRRSHGALFLIAILSVTGLQVGCESKTELPEIAVAPALGPLHYSTRPIALPGCAISPPPVQDDLAVCPADEIGRSIKPSDVCLMLKALKDWMSTTPLDAPVMQPHDWSRIRSILVCRMAEARDPIEDAKAGSLHWRVTIYADVPERPRLFWVDMRDENEPFRFGAVHR